MMPVLPYGLAALAGVCLCAGFNHLQTTAAAAQRRMHQLFAAMCFMIAIGACFSIANTQTDRTVDAVLRVRWIIGLVCVVNVLFPWFIASYAEARSSLLPSCISALYGVLLIANCLLPYGLWFSAPPVLQSRRLLWGEQVTGYAPQASGIWRDIFWVAQAALFIYMVALCIAQFRRGSRRRAIVLAICIGVLVLVVVNDWLVSMRISQMPSTGLFGFLALILVMSWSLGFEKRQAEKRMQSVLDHVPAVIYVKDLAGRYLVVNRHFEQLFHVTNQSVIGRTDAELFAPTTAQLLSHHDSQVLTAKQPLRYEEQLDKGGALHTFLSLKFPLAGGADDPTPFAIAGIATDITERMRTEQALRSSEAQTRLLLDSTEQGIIGTDLNGCCTFVNRAGLSLLGYDQAQELHGSRIAELLHCAATAVDSDAFAPVRRTLQSGASNYSAFVNCTRRDGSSFAVEYWAHAIRSKGKVVGAVLSFVDISERKRVDDAIRALAEASAALDSEAFFQYCARSLAEVYDAHYAVIGLFNRERTRVRTVASCIDHRIVDNFEYDVAHTPCAEVSANSRLLIAANLTTLYSNEWLKSLQAESYFGTPIVSPSGIVTGLVAVLGRQPLRIGSSSESMLDVFAHRISVELDRKLAFDRLNELNDSLERRVAERTHELSQMNEELEAFSYSVSHDLRAPLTTIGGFSGLLLEQYADTLDDNCKRYLQHIAAGAQRMGGLIDALLSLARITRKPLRLHAVDLAQLASEVLHKLREAQPARSVAVSIAPQLLVFGDQSLLAVALDNLLGNAWKYTGKTAAARIELGAVEQNGETVYYVRDNGAGFDPHYASKLFQPFQRLHHQNEFPGTGIGLATVARIIHRHEGRIWAEGMPGAGATFYFTLKQAHASSSVNAAAFA